jgi:hypothetical protein
VSWYEGTSGGSPFATGNGATTTTRTMTTDKMVRVVITKRSYTLTLAANPANAASFSPTSPITVLAGGAQSVSVTALTPRTNAATVYQWKGWSNGSNATSYNVAPMLADSSLTASVRKIAIGTPSPATGSTIVRGTGTLTINWTPSNLSDGNQTLNWCTDANCTSPTLMATVSGTASAYTWSLPSTLAATTTGNVRIIPTAATSMWAKIGNWKVSAAAACTKTAWAAGTAYSGGAQVSYGGNDWQACYWTQGNPPAGGTTSCSGQYWKLLGTCQ